MVLPPMNLAHCFVVKLPQPAIEAFARDLAAAGFATLTPDLFSAFRGASVPGLERVWPIRHLRVAAQTLDFLRSPPGNRLEALRGGRFGQYSIRINDQFRVCFRWVAEGPTEVEIVDYH
mgnify:CR=1 FL=1